MLTRLAVVSLALTVLLAAGAVSARDHAGAGASKDKAFVGALSAKAADAAAGVAGVLTVKGAEGAADEKVNLLADGDLATQVTALIGKTVSVKGTKGPDGIKVTAIEEKESGGSKGGAKGGAKAGGDAAPKAE